MVTNDQVMIAVMASFFSSEVGAHILETIDFHAEEALHALERQKLFTITTHGAKPVDPSALAYTHFWNKGRMWVALRPELLPPPPYLLTTNQRFHMIYHGPVNAILLEDIHHEIADELSRNDHVEIPLAGDEWIGVVSFSSRDDTNGTLLAFSMVRAGLPNQLEDLVVAGEAGYPFGSLRKKPKESG